MAVIQAAFTAAAALVVIALSGCSSLPSLGLGADAGSEAAAEPPRVSVRLSGLDERQERNVRAYLGLAEEPCDAPEWRVRRRFASIEKDVALGLRPLGHYRPRVTASSLEHGDGCWSATVQVDPGPAVTVSSVDVRVEGDGGTDPAFQALLADLPLAEGQVLDHGRYEAIKRKLSSLASERGYQEARITRGDLVVDPDAGTARIHVTLDSGPRYRLGEATVRSKSLDEDVIRRFMEHQPGEPYSADRLHRLDQALSDSGYFASVDVRADTDHASDRTIPVTVTTEPRKRHLYTAGAGYATDTGPRVRLGYENRRINRRGHRLETRLRASPAQSDLTAEYRVPLQRPRSEWLTFAAAASREDTNTFESTAGKLSVRTTHLRGPWLETAFLDLSRDDFQVGHTSGVSTFLTPGVSYARTQSDGSLRPDRGWRLFAEVRGAAEGLLSTTWLLRGRLAAGWLRSLPWGGRIITRAEAGALMTGDFKALPPSLRFFAGGDNSVRGYDFDSLGPRDGSGEVVGGRYLGVVSAEYEHPIQGKWSAATFVDAGNAFDNDFDQGLKTAVGMGLRWQSPVGPVRVDLAHPLNDDTLVRLHVRLGPDL